MFDIILTQESKGYATIRKECPNCKAIFFFGVKDSKVAFIDGDGFWEPNNIVKCKVCESKYRFEVKDV